MTYPIIRYAFDPTGYSPNNAITGEEHILPVKTGPFHVIAPFYGPYFNNGLTLKLYKDNVLLEAGIHYGCVGLTHDLTGRFNDEVCELLLIKGMSAGNTITVSYQSVGGLYQNYIKGMLDLYNATLVDERKVDWENLLNKPTHFQPAYHFHTPSDVVGWAPPIVAVERLINVLSWRNVPAFDALVKYVDSQLKLLNARIPRTTAAQIAALLARPAGDAGDGLAETPVLKLNNLLQFKNWVMNLLTFKAGVNSQVFTGVPTAPTLPLNTTGEYIATTAYVQASNTADLGEHGEALHSPVYGLSPAKVIVNEGDITAVTVYTKNVPDNTVLYWHMRGSNLTPNDFSDNLLVGTVTIKGGVGAIFRTLSSDFETEGIEVVTVDLLATSDVDGNVLAQCQFFIRDSSVSTEFIYSITPSPTDINEGDTVLFDVASSSVPDNTVLYWTLVSNDMDETDFVDGQTQGQVTIFNNTAYFHRVVKDPLSKPEGSSLFSLQLHTDSPTGPVVGQSSYVRVDQVYHPPTYTVEVTTTAENEGTSRTYLIRTTYVPDGTLVYWNSYGSNITVSDFTDGVLSGTAAIENGEATITRTTTLDLTAEGTETFTIEFRQESFTGLIIGSFNGLAILDTSVQPAGELLSEACVGFDRVGSYADGNGGSYTEVIETNSLVCGYVAPPASGTLISENCVGFDLVGTYHNGTGGQYTSVITANAASCGYVPPPVYPVYGTYISEACVGFDLVGTYHNGSGGQYTSVITANAASCGYVPPPAYGTYLSEGCEGVNLMGYFANGTGGSYPAIIEANAASCGYYPPLVGQLFTQSGDYVVPQGATSLYVLIVAGGGGGASSMNSGLDEGGGGGGAGGVVTATINGVWAGQNLQVIVGAGGGANTNGNISTFAGYTAVGGGCGAYRVVTNWVPEHTEVSNKGNSYTVPAAWVDTIIAAGADGGSGGGGHGHDVGAGGAGTLNQGNAGGTGWIGSSGGGGGVNAAGGHNGGDGGPFTIGNETYVVAGGGGGGAGYEYLGLGGIGGGGDGAQAGNGNNGAPNTGGGGGGAGREDAGGGTGGSGGSGMVYIFPM